MQTSSSRHLPVWLLLLGSLGSIIGFAWSEQDYVAATALAIVTLSGLWGYLLGGARVLGYVASLSVAFGCAVPAGKWLEPHLAPWLGNSPDAARLAAIAAAGTAIFTITLLIVGVLTRRALKDRPGLDVANRLVGFGCGGLQGAAVVLILLGGALATEGHAQRRLRERDQGSSAVLARAVSREIVELADGTRRSTLGPLVQKYNPFENISQLKNLQQTATLVSDPDRFQQFMHSPAVDRLKRNKEVRAAIESLAQDPQLRRLAESGQPLDQQTAISLLSHPGVAKLLQQPDLMKHFAEAMNDVQGPGPEAGSHASPRHKSRL